MKLLTPAEANAKTAKGADLGVEAMILHLAPARLSGHQACPMASVGCAAACLNTAGRGGIGGPDNAVQRARVRKTRWFFEDRPGFMAVLVREIAALERRAAKAGKVPAVRLNGTSDIRWELVACERDGVAYPSVMAAFPDVRFYDYTKIPNRRHLPPNYHLTFSLSEGNDRHALAALAHGLNVAAVIDHGGAVPATWSGYPVVDGDGHDFRFLDPASGHVVALTPKGRAKHDGSGFVRTVDGRLEPGRAPSLEAVRAATERRMLERTVPIAAD